MPQILSFKENVIPFIEDKFKENEKLSSMRSKKLLNIVSIICFDEIMKTGRKKENLRVVFIHTRCVVYGTVIDYSQIRSCF